MHCGCYLPQRSLSLLSLHAHTRAATAWFLHSHRNLCVRVLPPSRRPSAALWRYRAVCHVTAGVRAYYLRTSGCRAFWFAWRLCALLFYALVLFCCSLALNAPVHSTIFCFTLFCRAFHAHYRLPTAQRLCLHFVSCTASGAHLPSAARSTTYYTYAPRRWISRTAHYASAVRKTRSLRCTPCLTPTLRLRVDCPSPERDARRFAVATRDGSHIYTTLPHYTTPLYYTHTLFTSPFCHIPHPHTHHLCLAYTTRHTLHYCLHYHCTHTRMLPQVTHTLHACT